jgi:hypothetical protein
MRAFLPFAGPAVIASIAYMDPGNFATNIEAGARFGYALLWVVLLANLTAMLFQSLSAKVGIVTGKSLAQHCGERLPKPLVYAMWGASEVAAMATDLAEFLGAALGLGLSGTSMPLGSPTVVKAEGGAPAKVLSREEREARDERIHAREAAKAARIVAQREAAEGDLAAARAAYDAAVAAERFAANNVVPAFVAVEHAVEGLVPSRFHDMLSSPSRTNHTIAVPNGAGYANIDVMAFVEKTRGSSYDDRWNQVGYLIAIAGGFQLFHFYAVRFKVHVTR